MKFLHLQQNLQLNAIDMQSVELDFLMNNIMGQRRHHFGPIDILGICYYAPHDPIQ